MLPQQGAEPGYRAARAANRETPKVEFNVILS